MRIAQSFVQPLKIILIKKMIPILIKLEIKLQIGFFELEIN